MTLRDPAVWKKVLFHAVDAVRVSAIAGDGRQIQGLRRMRQEDKLSPEAQVVTDGWDHEHCELCNANIGPGDYAYTKTDNLWICLTCFENPKIVSVVDNL
jgi:hypothetical protein